MGNSTTVQIDLTGYKERFSSNVPEGTYVVQVTDTELDTSKQGNQMINLWLRIIGTEVDGYELVDRLVLSKNSLFRVVAFMQAIGVPVPRQRLQIDTAKWIGRKLEVTVEDGEPYNGRVRSEVRGYARLTSDVAPTAPADLPDDLPDSPPQEAPVFEDAVLVDEPQDAPEADPADQVEEAATPVTSKAKRGLRAVPVDEEEIDLANLQL